MVVAEKKLVVEKKQSKIYIDFPPRKVETSQNKPTKIYIIIQLVDLLEALIPNRELLQSLIMLVNFFIFVAFTSSAIYASYKIYANIFNGCLSSVCNFSLRTLLRF